MKKRILVGDIGGTQSSFAVVELPTQKLQTFRRYLSKEFQTFEELLSHIAITAGPLQGCIIAAAGPVENQRCVLTHLPWVIDQKKVARILKVPLQKTRIMNDFEAAAWGLLTLEKKDQLIIQQGKARPNDPCTILGPGTGLGEAFVIRSPHVHIIPTEGGHSDIAPRTTEQSKLMTFIQNNYGLRSAESVLSGHGISRIYEFLTKQEKDAEEITSRAIRGEKQALHTIHLFWQLLAQEAAALALQGKATGGVVIAGGIAPKLIPLLNKKQFIASFTDNKEMHKMLCTIPVSIITLPHAALQGMALASLQLF